MLSLKAQPAAFLLLMSIFVEAAFSYSYVPSPLNRQRHTSALRYIENNDVDIEVNSSPTTTQDAVRFEQNSKLMYDKILEGTPFFVRETTKTHLNNGIADLCEGVVTESKMYDVVKKVTPKPFLKQIVILDAHKTDADAKVEETIPSSKEEDISTITSCFALSGKKICFVQNSRQMYDAILEGHPAIVRGVVQKNLETTIAVVCDKIVTESGMYDVIKRASPRTLLAYNMDILDKVKTDQVSGESSITTANNKSCF